MIIEVKFAKYVVFSEDSILSALNKISANKERVIFSVSEKSTTSFDLSRVRLPLPLTSSCQACERSSWLPSVSKAKLKVRIERKFAV